MSFDESKFFQKLSFGQKIFRGCCTESAIALLVNDVPS